MRKRLKALERTTIPPKPGQRIWLDDEPTFEIRGVTWCHGHEPRHLNRIPGESIQELKNRCLHAARNAREGIVFLMDYGATRVPERSQGVHVMEEKKSCR